MDMLSVLRMLGALGVVLGLLEGGFWLARRHEFRLPQGWLSRLPSRFSGFSGKGATRRMELVERLALDPRRSVALIRKDGCEHMLLIAPEGLMLLDSPPQGKNDDA